MHIKNTELIKEYFTHFNNHDWEKIANMYSDPAEFKDPSFGPEVVIQTRKQTVKKYREMSEVFSSLHDEVISNLPIRRESPDR